MSEEKTNSDIVTDSVQAATQELQESQPSGESESSHGVQNNQIEEVTETKITDEPTEEAMRKEYGKLRQTQAEFETLKKESEETKAQNDAYVNWILNNPDRAKEALIDIEGYTAEQAAGMVTKIQKKEEKAQSMNPDDLRTYIAQEVQIERKKDEFVRMFPDLNPSKASGRAELGKMQQKAENIVGLADSLMRANPKITEQDAWKQAHDYVSGKVSDEREEGKLEGMMLINNNNATTKNSSVAGTQMKNSTATFTDIEREVMKQTGMSEKDYAAYR